MERPLVLALSAATLAIAACFTGPSVGGFAPAVTGHGVESTIDACQLTLAGELLEASDSGYVVLEWNGLTYTPYALVRKARFSGIGSYGSGRPSPQQLEQLRLLSRFPQGMPRETVRALLAASGQAAPRVVRP